MIPRFPTSLGSAFLGLLAFALLSSSLVAQTRGITVAAGGEHRVALVIGNSAYRGTMSPLKNPANDADDVAAALRKAGFQVDLRKNLTMQQMETAARDFSAKLGGNTVGLFYFAGHGAQINGQNYLMPVDANVTTEEEVRYKAPDAGFFIAQIKAKQNPLNLVILDACRDNPLPRSTRSGATRGLASINAPRGTLIAYSTSPGDVALDGTGRNSPYAAALIQELGVPDVAIESMFRRVRNRVMQQTGGKQSPWESNNLMGDDFFLVRSPKPVATPAAAIAAPAPAPAPAPAETAAASGAQQEDVGTGPAAEWHLKGKALWEEKKYAASEKAHHEAVRLAPKNALYQMYFGAALLGRERYKEAEPVLREALRLDPNSARARAVLGNALFALKRHAEGELMFRDAVRMEPANAELRAALAGALLTGENPQEAEVHLSEAVRIAPSEVAFHNLRGVALLRLKRGAEAEAALRIAVRLAPGDAAARGNLGHALYLQNRTEEAIAELEAAAKLDPKNRTIRSSLEQLRKATAGGPKR